MNVIVLDEGSETCKLGFAADAAAGPAKVVPNYAVRQRNDRRMLVADQCAQVTEYTSLLYRRPKDKGLVIDWELETLVWSRMFGSPASVTSAATRGLLNSDAALADTALCLLESPLCPQGAQYMELALETHGFGAVHRSMSAAHAAALPALDFPPTAAAIASNASASANASVEPPACALVVDAGFSGCSAVPVYRSRPIASAVKRMDLGGKVLTNYLKDVLTYRQWDVMDETYLVNDIKEKLCYVSLDFEGDLAKARVKRAALNTIRREYVLPNNSTTFIGKVKPPRAIADPATAAAAATAASSNDNDDDEDEEHAIAVTNERFSVPELLFRPQDIGYPQSGLAETVAAAVAAAPAELRGLLWGNIVLVGGCFNLPNAAERLLRDLRPHVPAEAALSVRQPADPITAGWRAGARFAAQEGFVAQYCVTKAEWAEAGDSVVKRKFLV